MKNAFILIAFLLSKACKESFLNTVTSSVSSSTGWGRKGRQVVLSLQFHRAWTLVAETSRHSIQFCQKVLFSPQDPLHVKIRASGVPATQIIALE